MEKLPENYVLEKVEASVERKKDEECIQIKKTFILLKRGGVIVLSLPEEKFSEERVRKTISQIEAMK